MKPKTTVLFVLALVIAAGTGAVVKSVFTAPVTAQADAHPKTYPAFTLQSRIIHINPTNNSQYVEKKTRYVSANGSWRVVITNEDGKTMQQFFERGRGFFKVDERNKKLKKNNLASTEPAAPQTAEQLRSSPQFLRTEEVLGFTTYILRVTDQATGKPMTDLYYAVQLGGIPLKVINYDYGKQTLVDEAVSITFGEPNSSLTKGPDYPVAD